MKEALPPGRVRPIFRILASLFVIVGLPLVVLCLLEPHRNWGFIAGGLTTITIFAYAAIASRLSDESQFAFVARRSPLLVG